MKAKITTKITTETTAEMHHDVYICGEEKNKVIVIDDFHPDPSTLFKQAQTEPYFTAQADDFYPGKRKPVDDKYANYLTDKVEHVLRHTYGVGAEKVLEMGLCAYSLTTKTEQQLRPIQCIPHIDTHDKRQFAVVHYLCRGEFGGTSFYRHRSSAYESIDNTRLKSYFAQLKKEIINDTPTTYINGDTALFQKLKEVGFLYNRAVIYPSNILHSGNINPNNSLSSDPRTGRLTINTFVSFSDSV